jgi:hypothetical protein
VDIALRSQSEHQIKVADVRDRHALTYCLLTLPYHSSQGIFETQLRVEGTSKAS